MKTGRGVSNTRIAFVANVGYSLFQEVIRETYGGAQIDMYLLAKEFSKKQNYEVAMIFLDYGQPSYECIDGIHLFKSYRPRHRGLLVWQFIVACHRLWGALRRANADLYFHEGAEFEIAVTRLFCLIKKRKYVYRCANIIEVDGRYHRAHPFHGLLFSFGLSGAHAIITQTKDQEHFLVKKGKRVTIIESVFPYHARPQSTKDKIVWIGRLTKIKRPELFLRLAEYFFHEHFFMVGSVDTIDREYAHTIQLQARTIQNLDYVEKIPFRQIPEIFDRAQLLVNTSEYEGFPVTVVQAMCHGVPVLAMGIDPDKIVSKNAGYVARDEQELREKFSQILQPTTWKHYSLTSLEYAKNRFSPQIIIPKYEEIFQSILENNLSLTTR